MRPSGVVDVLVETFGEPFVGWWVRRREARGIYSAAIRSTGADQTRWSYGSVTVAAGRLCWRRRFRRRTLSVTAVRELPDHPADVPAGWSGPGVRRTFVLETQDGTVEWMLFSSNPDQIIRELGVPVRQGFG